MSKHTLLVFKKLLSGGGGGGGGSTTTIRSVTTLISGTGVTDLLDIWCDEHGKTYASEHEKQERMPYPIDRRYAFVVGLNRYDDDNHNYYKDKNTHSLSFGVSTFQFDRTILASQQVICCDSLSEWNTLFHNFIQTNTLVVVEFGVSWLRPILGEIAKKTPPDAIFVKVDVDDLNNPMKEYKVDTLPSFVFFKQGKVIDKVGNNKEQLAAKVTMHSTASASSSSSLSSPYM